MSAPDFSAEKLGPFDFALENQPVFFYGPRQDPGVPPSPGAFLLARKIVNHLNWLQTSSITVHRKNERPQYAIEYCDPVTTRVLQQWRPTKHQSKKRWIDEFIGLRPDVPLLCWLVVMRAVEVVDVLNAIGEYGWSPVAPTPAGEHSAPARVRLDEVAGSLPEFRRRIEWALECCASQYGLEYVDRADASTLLSACESADAASQADARDTTGPA